MHISYSLPAPATCHVHRSIVDMCVFCAAYKGAWKYQGGVVTLSMSFMYETKVVSSSYITSRQFCFTTISFIKSLSKTYFSNHERILKESITVKNGSSIVFFANVQRKKKVPSRLIHDCRWRWSWLHDGRSHYLVWIIFLFPLLLFGSFSLW